MKTILTSLRVMMMMTLLLGGLYPSLVYVTGKFLFPQKYLGQLIEKDDVVIGSAIIGQHFSEEKFFWSRPSAVDYHSALGGASQLSPSSKRLNGEVKKRKEMFQGKAPLDLLYSSASGLDPHISPEAAQFQKERVRLARNISQEKLDKLILEATEERILGFMGQPRVNVLKLNLSLESR